MSELMKDIEGVRSSDVFDLTAVGFPAYWTDKQVLVCGRALRNYDETKDKLDALTERNRLLQLGNEQLAKDKAELVEALTAALAIWQNFCDKDYIDDFDEETECLDKILEKHKCD